ncbi:MAG: PEP-CTERM sorting domain-containing protein [Armatimonadetes bacterium]|nr:PEP-CTERM sorting domain-containing protein [Armatimonadota bacterium]
MRTNLKLTLATLAAAALVGSAVAQNPNVFHASARLIPPAGGRANVVYLMDATGTVTGQYNEIAAAAGDAWGYRDGAADRNNNVYFGWGGGVARHRADGTGGVLQFPNLTPTSTIRALAFDPTGNGGLGSFWTANFGSALYELNMTTGAVITTHLNLDSWSLYGLSYDDATGDLWGHSRNSTATNEAEVIEISKGTGRTTGVGFFTASVYGVPGSSPGGFGIQGGLSAYRAGGGYTLAGVFQATSDTGFTSDTAGNLTGPFAPNPRDFEAQTTNGGHLGIASPVPEPASLLALGVGLAALAARRRRKA